MLVQHGKHICRNQTADTWSWWTDQGILAFCDRTMASIFINYAMVDMDRMLDDAVPIGLCTLYLQGCFHERTGDASGYAVKFNNSPDVRALSKKNSLSVGANALGSSRLLLPHLCFVKPEPLQHCLEPNPVSYKKRLVISGLTMRFWRHRSKSRLVDRWQIAPNCSRSPGPTAVAVHQRLLPALFRSDPVNSVNEKKRHIECFDTCIEY